MKITLTALFLSGVALTVMFAGLLPATDAAKKPNNTTQTETRPVMPGELEGHWILTANDAARKTAESALPAELILTIHKLGKEEFPALQIICKDSVLTFSKMAGADEIRVCETPGGTYMNAFRNGESIYIVPVAVRKVVPPASFNAKPKKEKQLPYPAKRQMSREDRWPNVPALIKKPTPPKPKKDPPKGNTGKRMMAGNTAK